MNKTLKVFIIIFLISLVLSACSPTADTPIPDQISVRLKWTHGVQFAGFYIAEQKGYFAEENLSVSLLEGGLEFDELELVSTGQDDFGVVGGQTVVSARLDGYPIKAVATVFQISPAVYFSLAESGIERPEDFVGKRVMVFPSDTKLKIILKNVGVNMDQIIAVPPSTDLSSLYAGEEDVWTGYVTNQVVRARLDGHEINVIYPEDYGIFEYGDCIIATDEMILGDPDLIERFIRAAMRGWRYAIENPAEAAQIASQYADIENDTFLLASMEAQVPLIHNGAAPIGWMEFEDWQAMCDLFLPSDYCEDEFKTQDVFTQQFLNAVYGYEE